MKHKTPSEEHSQSHHTVDGPGSQLRKARERLGLEQAKVAAQLHLSQSMIHALEWDDYDKLPAAVFVQGYLRNYARLLGVDEDSVILTYQELHPDEEQAPLPRNQPDEVALELHNDNRLMRYVAWGVLLALGVVVFFWWQGRMGSSQSPPVRAEHEVVEPGFSSVEPGGMDLAPAQTPPPIRDSGMEPAATAVDRSPGPITSAPALSPVPATEPIANESVPTAAAEPVSETPLTETETPESGQPSYVEAEPATPAAGRVVFEFSGPCWVEVRDANGSARILGVMREGVRRSLDSRLGPFRVVIGDIHAVRVSVNGEAYDLQRHARGKVARFTLDPSSL